MNLCLLLYKFLFFSLRKGLFLLKQTSENTELPSLLCITLFFLFWGLHWVFTAVRGLSLVAVCRLSCPAEYGILVPQPGIESALPALESKFLTTGSPEKSLHNS